MTFYFLLAPNSDSSSTLLIETIEHYVHDSRQPDYGLLLDTSEAFDRVCNNELFTMLIERNVSPFLIRFRLFMYTHQYMRVRWNDSLSDNFSIGNRVVPFIIHYVYIYVI